MSWFQAVARIGPLLCMLLGSQACRGPTEAGCPAGEPGCACVDGAGCSAGFECLSNLCVAHEDADDQPTGSVLNPATGGGAGHAGEGAVTRARSTSGSGATPAVPAAGSAAVEGDAAGFGGGDPHGEAGQPGSAMAGAGAPVCVPAEDALDSACAECGGTIECDGTCNVPIADDRGESCGQCGGTVECDGSCSVETPDELGVPCGQCGGQVLCDGSCSVGTPANVGNACGGCGGTTQCDGSCSIPTPSNFGSSCGGCGGTVQCNGSCSVGTPSNLGAACGSCGGTVQCNGACSVGTPSNFGAACGSCGGTVQCNGACNKATPSNLGQVISYSVQREAFSCCSIDYLKTFGGGCHPGYVYAGIDIVKISGGGTCQLNAEQVAGSCSDEIWFHNNGLEGATCDIVIKERRVCD